MKKKQKNEIYRLLDESGMGVENFELIETDGGNGFSESIIKYKDTPFEFIIRNPTHSFDEFYYYFTTFSPVFTSAGPFPPVFEEYTNFDVVIGEIEAWITNHIKEFIEEENEPDLWSAYKNGNRSLDFDAIDFDDRSAFTSDERKQIEMAMNEYKLLIQKNFNTTEEQQKLVAARLDYLIEASTRVNKFDWKSLSISTIINISVALSLDTSKGQMLFELFKKVMIVIHQLSPVIP